MFLIIRDQIHGDMHFSDAEMKLINSRSFERLRYIKQLAFADYQYPSAVHTRYQHSLGVCQCVTDMYNAVIRNYPDFYREGDLELLRMMALCHDLGHSPFSHASEELSNISHEERLREILEVEKKNIILPNTYGVDNVVDLIYEVYMGEGVTYLSNPHLMALHSFLDNFVDADKLDYLERDAINCGVGYGKFDRQALINNLTVAVKDGFEIIALKSSGVQALESFILARYYMFSQVYFHPYERILRYQYCEEMKTILKDGKYPDDIRKFLALDDTKFSRKLKFLRGSKYALIYDDEFNDKVYSVVSERLKGLVLCDIPRKNIFRKGSDDSTIYIQNELSGNVVSCAEASPILKNIEFTCVHKLRFYAETSVADEVRAELQKIVKGVLK